MCSESVSVRRGCFTARLSRGFCVRTNGDKLRLARALVTQGRPTACHVAQHHAAQAVEEVSPTADQEVGRDLDVAGTDLVESGDQRGLLGTDGFLLCLEAGSLSQALLLDGGCFGGTDGRDFGRIGGAESFHHLALALCFCHRGVSFGRLDVDADTSRCQLPLHVGHTTLLFERDACLLGNPLVLEGCGLLSGDLSLRQDGDQILREHDILDVDTLGLDVVGVEVPVDVHLGLCLDVVTLLDELRGAEGLQLVPEVVAHCRLQDLVDEVGHGPDHRDDLGGHGVRHMDLHLQIDAEVEGFLRLGIDRRQMRIQVMGGAVGVRPVEGQDRGGHDLRTVDARVQGELAGAQWLRPDPLMSRLHDGAELELFARGVFRRQAQVGLDDGDFTLADHQHRNQFHLHQQRIEHVRSVGERVMLQAVASAGVQEGLEVLVAVVAVVLRTQHLVDDLRVRRSAADQRCDVVESTDSAGKGARIGAFESRHHAHHILVALRGDVEDTKALPVDAVDGLFSCRRDDRSERVVRCEYHEGNRVQWGRRARRQDVPLHTTLTTSVQECSEVVEVPELGLVDGRLGSTGQGSTALGHDQPDVVGRDLDPVVGLDLVDRPELEPPAGHEELGLVASFAVEGDQLIRVELLPADLLGDQADFRRPDVVERLRQESHDEDANNESEDSDQDRNDRDAPGCSEHICMGRYHVLADLSCRGHFPDKNYTVNLIYWQ